MSKVVLDDDCQNSNQNFNHQSSLKPQGFHLKVKRRRKQMSLNQLRHQNLVQRKLQKSLTSNNGEEMLEKDAKTGVTKMMDEEKLKNKIMQMHKYDESQNYLLRRNPLVIKQQSFYNQQNLNQIKTDSIMDVLQKQFAMDNAIQAIHEIDSNRNSPQNLKIQIDDEMGL